MAASAGELAELREGHSNHHHHTHNQAFVYIGARLDQLRDGIDHHPQKNGPEHCSRHGADAAGERAASHYGCCNRVELVPSSLVHRSCHRFIGHVEQAGECGCHRPKAIGKPLHILRANTGQTGSLFIASESLEMAAEHGAGQEQPGNKRQHAEHSDWNRDIVANGFEQRIGHIDRGTFGRREGTRRAFAQCSGKTPQAHQRRQRGDEGGQTHRCDQPGMQGADQKTGEQTGGNGQGHHQRPHRLEAHHLGWGQRQHGGSADGAGEGNHRSRREIDTPGDDYNCCPQSENSQQGSIAGDVAQAFQRLIEIAVIGVGQSRQQNRQTNGHHESPFTAAQAEDRAAAQRRRCRTGGSRGNGRRHQGSTPDRGRLRTREAIPPQPFTEFRERHEFHTVGRHVARAEQFGAVGNNQP